MLPENRKYALIILIVLLAAMQLKTVLSHPWLDLRTCLGAPAAYHGATITHFQEAVLKEFCDGGFILAQKNSPDIRVIADTAGLRAGDYLSLNAEFNENGWLTAREVRSLPDRRLKIWLSVIPALAVLILAGRTFRYDRRKNEITVRRHA